MVGPATTWWFFFTVGVIVGGAILWKRRPNLAVGASAALALLAPTWVKIGADPLAFDVRTSLACVMLIAYCFHPLGTLRYPQNWLDGVVLGIIVLQTMIDVAHGGYFPVIFLRAVGEWSVPYLAGRCCVLFRGSVAWLAPWFSGTVIVLAIGAIVESWTGLNPWEVIFCPVDDLVERTRDQRYDLLFRAAGPTRHPIFLAILFLLLAPWTIALIERGESQRLRVVGWFALGMAILGIAATVSRGPMIAILIATAFAVAVIWTRLRLAMVALAMASFLGVFFFSEQLASIVEKTDTTGGRGKLVTVDGEGVVYTGTRNRLLVWRIYGPLVVKGGLFGYGTEAIDSFPPNIPGLPKAARAAETLRIVDNSYLLFGLRFGWIGLTLFVLLVFGAIALALSRRRAAGLIFYPYGDAFLIALASVLAGVMFEIATVYLSYEFGYWLIFTCGISAGLCSLHQRLLNGANE